MRYWAPSQIQAKSIASQDCGWIASFNTCTSNVLKALKHLQKRGAIVRTNKLDAPSVEAALRRVAD